MSTVQQIQWTLLSFYLACENGFTGTNCVTKCQYPTYGQGCQSVCDCNATVCDYVNGCNNASESKIPYQYYPLSSIWNVILNNNNKPEDFIQLSNYSNIFLCFNSIWCTKLIFFTISVKNIKNNCM